MQKHLPVVRYQLLFGMGRDTLRSGLFYESLILDGSITTKDSGSCKVSFEPVGASSLNMCVTVEEFHIEDCNATVNYYHYGDSERKAVITLFFLIPSIFVCTELLHGVQLQS